MLWMQETFSGRRKAMIRVTFKDEDELSDGRPIGPVKVWKDDELVWASDIWQTLTQARKIAMKYGVELERF